LDIKADDIPTFQVVFSALLGESARGAKIKWTATGFSITFVGSLRVLNMIFYVRLLVWNSRNKRR
jgi:hypothetical protein